MSREEHADCEMPHTPFDRYVLLRSWLTHLEAVCDPRADDVAEEMDEIWFDSLTDDEVMVEVMACRG